MSSEPVSAPAREPQLLSVAEFLALSETERLRSSSWRSSSPPGSKRTDHVAKRADYADAGIPHYWIVDLDDPISLVACHLDGELGYIDGGAVTGVFDTTEPFPVRLDLGALG